MPSFPYEQISKSNLNSGTMPTWLLYPSEKEVWRRSRFGWMLPFESWRNVITVNKQRFYVKLMQCVCSVECFGMVLDCWSGLPYMISVQMFWSVGVRPWQNYQPRQKKRKWIRLKCGNDKWVMWGCHLPVESTCETWVQSPPLSSWENSETITCTPVILINENLYNSKDSAKVSFDCV